MFVSRASSGIGALLIAVLGLGFGPDVVAAQQRQLVLEANPLHGTLGYGRERRPGLFTGVEVGFGFPQFDRTWVPDDDDYLGFFHVGAFVRHEVGRRFLVDGRALLGLGELDGCSGCWPGLFTGGSGAVLWGGRRVRVGSRVTFGVIAERGTSRGVVYWTPAILTLTHTW